MEEDNRAERAKKFAKIWWKSRAQAGVSQEYMALGLGVSKKTVQNWEKGVSSPTMFQCTEWFRLLGINPMPYYLEFVFGEEVGMSSGEDADKIETEMNQIMSVMPLKAKEQLVYLFSAVHGSSPFSVLQMVMAHLHLPMRDRVTAASIILQSYQMQKQMDNLVNPDVALPDEEILTEAVSKGMEATVSGKSGYTTDIKE